MRYPSRVRYYVISSDGQRYGPADLATLNEWASQGRLLAHQLVEEETTGVRYTASTLTGLTFGQQQTYQAPGQPNPGYASYPRADGSFDNGAEELKQAWICGVVGLCCCGLVAIYGLIQANKAAAKGNPNATGAKVLNIVALVLNIMGGVLKVILQQ